MLFQSILFISTLTSVFADVDWGKKDPKTQYELQYGPMYRSTDDSQPSLEFCKKLRTATINYVGPKNYHHIIQCDVTAPGPTVYAFCGGVQKQGNGDYGKKGTPTEDFTRQVVASMKQVTILFAPGKTPNTVATTKTKTKSKTSKISTSTTSTLSSSTTSAITSTTALPLIGNTTTTTTSISSSSSATEAAAERSTVTLPTETVTAYFNAVTTALKK